MGAIQHNTILDSTRFDSIPKPEEVYKYRSWNYMSNAESDKYCKHPNYSDTLIVLDSQNIYFHSKLSDMLQD